VLREEVRRLGHRNVEREKALRDELETDNNTGEDNMGITALLLCYPMAISRGKLLARCTAGI
jgi:hypothetical protein